MAGNILGVNFFGGELGAVRIHYDSVDMGLTDDSTTLTPIKNQSEIMAGQYGTAPIKHIDTGQWWEVEANFQELTLARLIKIIPGATLSGDGTAIKFANATYIDLYANAKTLVLKRVDDVGADSTNDNFIFTCPKAAIVDYGEITFGPDTKKLLRVKWHIYYDRTTTNCHGYAGAASSLGL